MEFLITTIVAVILLVGVVSSCPSVCSCTDNPYGRYVTCSSRGLYSIPTDLPRNTHILRLERNFISEIENNAFNNLPILSSILLHFNQITSIQSGAFHNLTSLTYLSLNSNQITSIQADAFKTLTSLTYLGLNTNQITSIQEGTFNDLRGLSSFYLYSNQITSIQEGAFNNWTSLTYLHLYDNQITSIQPGTFNNLPSLNQLYLNDNQITSIQSGTFNNLPSLRELLLRNNPISFVSENAFQNLPQLTSLEFDMHCIDCNNVPFWRWLKRNQTFSKSVTCNDYDGKKLSSLKPNDFTGCIIPPSSLSIENVTPETRLLGTEGQDITVSCKAVGGTPAPNVALIIAGQTVASQPQSAQYTLTTINRSYDHKAVTCQASNPAYLQNSMTDSAMIYLNLRPLPPTITGNVGNIEETKPLDVTCTATGSRPRAALQWTIGQKDVTSNATEWSSHINATDTYTVLSDMTYSVGKSHNGRVLICKAVNVASSRGLMTSITLNVKFAPTVSVSDTTFGQNEHTRTVTCVPVGNPQSYTFYKWQHRSKYGVLIRELDGGQNSVLTLPSIPVENIYQDSGEYVCTAGNGIVGRDGRIKQTGSGYVIINAQPIFTNDNSLTQYGEFGGNVDINIYVYSMPKYTTLRWYRDNTQVSPSTKYAMSDSSAIVNDTFHGKDVQLDGYNCVLTIQNANESDFKVSYRLQFYYGFLETVQYTVLLESAIIQETSSSGLYAVIGGMACVITIIITIVIILGTLHFRRKKCCSGGACNDISEWLDNNDEMPSPNQTTNDLYEYIREGTSGTRNEDLQQRGGNVFTKTYEMLGMQGIPNIYADLSSEQEQRQSESTTEQYETLGEQDQPNVYEQIKKKEEPEDREYTNLKI